MAFFDPFLETGIVTIGAYGLLRSSGVLRRQGVRKDMFLYYTNLSNLWVVLFFLLRRLCSWFRLGQPAWLFADFARFAIAMSILTTMLIYHFMLSPQAPGSKPSASQEFGSFRSLSNWLVHYITPGLTLLDWLWLAPKAALRWSAAAAWTSIPLAYLLFTLLRAQTGRPIDGANSPYPYPFMDLNRLGWQRLIRNLSALWLVFWLLGLSMIGLVRLLSL